MADRLSDGELNHILSNREPYADALDLIAIRDEIAAVDARIAELTSTRLKRLANRSAIFALEARRGLLGTAEIGAREHVRGNPVKAEIYQLEMRMREETRATPAAPAQRPSSPSAAWLEREQAQRTAVPTLAGDDEDDD